ncbi:NTF2-like protein [Panus rudis PR-1116 ss-1]|nr:NTF2-like protein [Panus rudis PR-1116 ss-1]
MLSNPTSNPPPAGSRAIAANALRKAGLMDRDERMRDVSEKPTRKTTSTKASAAHKRPGHHKPRLVDALLGKDQPSSSNRNPMTVSRIAAQNEGLTIRGASKTTVATGRTRRNAISTPGSISSRISSSGMIELWQEFVRSRYNAEARFLNLERMMDDDFIKKHNMLPPGAPGASSREAAVIFKIAGRKLTPEPQTISLAHNNISNGALLQMLSHYVPRLANLSLEGNQIKTWRDLDYISGRRNKLEHLRELILIGNPVRELEYKNNRGDKFRSEMARRFPTLEILDREPITKIAFDVPTRTSSSSTAPKTAAPTTFPHPMAPSFITGVDSSIISNFLLRFFPLFDIQRSALLDVYHPSATFSFSANTGIPARARIEGFHHSKEMPNQRKLEWSPWLTGGLGGSRNLTRMAGGVDKAAKTLHVGAEEVIKAMADLPSTRHEVTGAPEKFCIDAWPVQHGDTMNLFVTLHGQFTELPSEGIRSFDRSFILAPAPEGSRAKLAGWDIMILSDQLSVRAYSSHEAWRPGPMRVQAGEQLPSTSTRTATASTPATINEPNNLASWISSLNPQTRSQLEAAVTPIPEPQRSLVLQICQKTGLNVAFAVQCLESNGWEFDRAVANFEQVKGTLPRDAFL